MFALNELQALVAKASIGAGLPVGHAQEVAAAALWLAQRGFPVCEITAHALECAAKRSGQVHEVTSRITLTNASAAIDGPNAIDVLIAKVDPTVDVVFENVDEPGLLLGLVGVAAERHQTAIAFRGAACHLTVGPAFWLDLAEVTLSGVRTILLSRAKIEGKSSGPAIASRYDPSRALDTGLWQLEKMAARTYVPSSTSSRTSGAGAGLTDND